ncbi:tyrosine-type recombinase/integrase [uncultured Shimia sp.]|uniref:tyrosine-type recombinase/integrase n=1 Tax=uncultured Shimia sp. TaxID=573152 RepID=UPI002619E41D|nr:tyrosine-type recombinase/integrase [uncultured Shimia sp.]
MALSLPNGLFKRGRGYALRIAIPNEYQPIIGKKEIVRGLGTQDLGEALVRRKEALEEILTSVGQGNAPEPVKTQVAKGSILDGTTVRETSHRWLVQSDGIKNSTKARYRQHLESFELFSGNAEVSKINRAMALAYMDHLRTVHSSRTGEPLSARSLQSYQSCLASYWRVLDHWGLVNSDMRNPFSSLLRRVAGQKKKIDPREKTLRPVTRREAESLLQYITNNDRLKYQFEMYVTVRLLWVTGCRLNEICGRYLSEIEDHKSHITIHINDSKTEAGNRVVMIVGDDDCDLLRRAIIRAETTEPCCPENRGRLFPRKNLGGYDKRPSHYLGKGLEAARKRLSGDHSQWDTHSFRRTAVSALVNAGVAREARNLAVGHSNKEDIGLSVYAKRGDLSEIIKTTFEALHVELGGSLKTPLSLTN